MTQPDLHGMSIATGTVFEPGTEGIKKLGHHCLVLNHGQDLASRVQSPTLAQSDHPIGPSSQFLGLGIGRLDTIVTQQRSHQIPHHGATVAGATVEFSSPF